MMKMLNLAPVVLALLVAGCSKSPTNSLSMKLEVDGKTVIDEKAKDTKTEALLAKHVALIDTLESACQLSSFLSQTVTSSGPGQTTAKSASMQSTEADGATTTQVLTMLKLQEAQVPNSLVLCTSGRGAPLPDMPMQGMAGCVLKPRTDGGPAQPQYGILARDYLQSKHGMKKVATVSVIQEESDGGKHLIKSEKVVQLTNEQISCTENLQQK